MGDPRVAKLAKVLVHYSLELKKGDHLRIRGDIGSAPLVLEIYREALGAGAHIYNRFNPAGWWEILFREASDDQLQMLSELDKFEIDFIDADLFIEALHNTRNLSGVNPARVSMRSAARASLNKRFDERATAGELRWNLTRYPTEAHAQDAGMSLDDYADFVYRACLIHEDDPVAEWKKLEAEQQRIADYLEAHDEIHILAPGTDITYRVGGRHWVNANGKINMPDGEVYSAPIEDSVNGVVTFSFPAIHLGNEVEGVRLTFQDGVVSEANADRGLNFLNAMLDTDEGSRRLGEVAFGMNYGVTQFSRDILFDEKLGGTMHMALGAAYAECGGKNDSGIHWDMICDMREGGEVYADGELCYKDGKFIF